MLHGVIGEVVNTADCGGTVLGLRSTGFIIKKALKYIRFF